MSIFDNLLGTVIGIPVLVIATTLQITVEVAQLALDAGCTTYTEIKKFVDELT